MLLKDWQIPKTKDCKLKCRIRLQNEPLLNEDKVIQDFLNRKFLRFNICLLKEPNKSEGKSRGEKNNSSSLVATYKDALHKGDISKFATNYIINIQLVKGTPLVFLDFT